MSACRMCYPLLAASLAGGRSRTWGRISSGEVARTATPPTWVTAMDASLRETGCARKGTGAPEATQLPEEQDTAWNESQKGTRFPSWFSWTQLRYQSQGEATSPSPVTLLSDGRAHGRCQTIRREKHGWEMLTISLLHSHQMLYRYYTNSFPSVGFACTCYNLIRRKLDFFCSHHKQKQHKHINLSLKFLFLLSEMPEDCPVNPMGNSLLHSMMNNGSSLYLPQMKFMPFWNPFTASRTPNPLGAVYISAVINPCNVPVHDTIHLDHQFS